MFTVVSSILKCIERVQENYRSRRWTSTKICDYFKASFIIIYYILYGLKLVCRSASVCVSQQTMMNCLCAIRHHHAVLRKLCLCSLLCQSASLCGSLRTMTRNLCAIRHHHAVLRESCLGCKFAQTSSNYAPLQRKCWGKCVIQWQLWMSSEIIYLRHKLFLKIIL